MATPHRNNTWTGLLENCRSAFRVILTIFVVAALVSFASAQVVGESALDPASTERAAQRLEDLVRDAIRDAGGDLASEEIHFVFGFSTGHFAGEPLRAQAARQTAMELVEDLGIRGDQVSAFAFEMGIWEQPGAERNPLTLPSDRGEEKAVAQEIFPLTTKADSQGGHDTELAIVQIAERVDPVSGPIIILFTNRAASITTSPSARPLIGENDPSYQGVLETYRRLEPVNRSGASLETVYDIERSDGELVTNALDIVVLVPRDFSGPPIVKGTRSERLAGANAPDSRDTGASVLPLILVLLGAIAAGGFLFFRSRRGGTSAVTLMIEDHAVPLTGFRNGETVANLVSHEHAAEGHGQKTVSLTRPGLPSGILASFYIRDGKVHVRDGELRLTAVDGSNANAPYPLEPDTDVRMTLTGSYVAQPGMPPKSVDLTLDTRVGRPS